MGFVIKKIVVHNEPTRVRAGDAHYNMARDKWDVRTLLEVNPIYQLYNLAQRCVLLFLLIKKEYAAFV